MICLGITGRVLNIERWMYAGRIIGHLERNPYKTKPHIWVLGYFAIVLPRRERGEPRVNPKKYFKTSSISNDDNKLVYLPVLLLKFLIISKKINSRTIGMLATAATYWHSLMTNDKKKFKELIYKIGMVFF